jgi:(p)ppGpp synthase/HD superfamily hydrolase
LLKDDPNPEQTEPLATELPINAFLFDQQDRVETADFTEVTLSADLSSERTYSIEEIATVRNSLKLTCKFLRDAEHGWGIEKALPLAAHAAETGMLLTLAAAPGEQVAAGILYDAYAHTSQEDWPVFDQVVERKFGAGVVELVHHSLASPEEVLSKFPDAAELSAAITLADLTRSAQGYSSERLIHLEEQFRQGQVPALLLEQLHLETTRQLRSERPAGSSYDVSDVVDVRNAMRAATLLFQDVERKWGPEETLPMVAHAAEVGLLLALARSDKDLISAGTLHDFLEGYTEHDPAQIREFVDSRFGSNTLQLIEGVTEPSKSSAQQNWYERKMAVLQQIEEGCPDIAALSCATKISTLSAGNKMLEMGRPISEWSAGGHKQNAAFFRLHLMQYRHKQVSELLVQEFERELEKFEDFIG